MPRRRNHRGITYSGQHTNHETDNLAGYPAVDIPANPGDPFRAPENGTIIRISGRDPRKGATSAHGAFGWSIYFKGQSGTIYFITHLGSVRDKGRYSAGSIIGTVGDFPGKTMDHAHVGIHVGASGLPDYAKIQSGGFWTGHGASVPLEALPGASTGIPAEQNVSDQTQPVVPPPNFPLGPQLPGSVTELPGDIPPDQGFQELSPVDYWQTLAEMPFSSPETQEWAARMRRHA